jgi:hypothetical protein
VLGRPARGELDGEIRTRTMNWPAHPAAACAAVRSYGEVAEARSAHRSCIGMAAVHHLRGAGQDRLCSMMSNEHAYCLAIEWLLGIEVLRARSTSA